MDKLNFTLQPLLFTCSLVTKSLPDEEAVTGVSIIPSSQVNGKSIKYK